MDKEIRVYRHSRAEAQELGESEEWLESYRANCICARAIDLAIKGGSSEKSIEEERVKSVLVRFGYDRVSWVLANTILYGEHGARYSEENKAWAESFSVPETEHCWRYNFTAFSPSGPVDRFTNQVREEWRKLGLYDKSHCYAEAMNYTGKIAVLEPSALKDVNKKPDYQLFYARSEIGCHSSVYGSKVFGVHLINGENTQYRSADFIGVMKLDLIPEWAQERYAKYASGTTVADEM